MGVGVTHLGTSMVFDLVQDNGEKMYTFHHITAEESPKMNLMDCYPMPILPSIFKAA